MQDRPLQLYLRVTTRLAHYIYQLCRLMTVTDVTRHLALDWKTVKAIDKHFESKNTVSPTSMGCIF